MPLNRGLGSRFDNIGNTENFINLFAFALLVYLAHYPIHPIQGLKRSRDKEASFQGLLRFRRLLFEPDAAESFSVESSGRSASSQR